MKEHKGFTLTVGNLIIGAIIILFVGVLAMWAQATFSFLASGTDDVGGDVEDQVGYENAHVFCNAECNKCCFTAKGDTLEDKTNICYQIMQQRTTVIDGEKQDCQSRFPCSCDA